MKCAFCGDKFSIDYARHKYSIYVSTYNNIPKFRELNLYFDYDSDFTEECICFSCAKKYVEAKLSALTSSDEGSDGNQIDGIEIEQEDISKNKGLI